MAFWEITKPFMVEFEGADGSGKHTQASIFHSYMTYLGQLYGKEAILTSFPSYESPSSYFVKKYLASDYDTAIREVNDADQTKLIFSFYGIDQFDTWHDINRFKDHKSLHDKYLFEAPLMTMDRFWMSNFIYQITRDILRIPKVYKNRTSIIEDFHRNIDLNDIVVDGDYKFSEIWGYIKWSYDKCCATPFTPPLLPVPNVIVNLTFQNYYDAGYKLLQEREGDKDKNEDSYHLMAFVNYLSYDIIKKVIQFMIDDGKIETAPILLNITCDKNGKMRSKNEIHNKIIESIKPKVADAVRSITK